MQGLTKRQAQTLDYIRQSIEERGYPPTLREIGEFMGIRSTNGVNDHLRALERKGYLRREDMKSRALRLVHDNPNLETAYSNASHGGTLSSSAISSDNLAGGAGSSYLKGAALGADLDASGSAGPDYRAGNSAAGNSAAGDSTVEVQVLGRVAAGLPLLAEENVIDTIRVDPSLVREARRGAHQLFGLRVQGDSMIEAGILSGDYIFVRRQSTAERGQIVVALIGEEATVKYYFPERDYIRFQPANSAMAPILVRATDFKSTMLLGIVVGVYRRI